MNDATSFLISSQNRDGGWGYKRGGISYVEPTAAALLALTGQTSASEANKRGRQFLRTLQRNDGGWGIASIDDESGWMTAWAVWALAGSDPSVAARGSDWLLRTEGIRVTDPAMLNGIRQAFKMDASLTGWPWQVGDASWVFPTALALLALNAASRRSHVRVEEGIRYLLDRAIPSGGWNIGNPFMLTGELPATLVNTALVTVSLGGFGVSGDVVDRAHKWLEQKLVEARTATELAWGTWAARVVKLDVEPALMHLQSFQLADDSLDRNPFTTAIGTLASTQIQPSP